MKTGISEEGINILCTKLDDYREKIYKILTEVEETTEKIKVYYKNESSKDFFDKLTQLNQNKQTINQNIQSYIVDLKQIKEAYINNDELLSEEIKNATTKVQERNGEKIWE